MSERAAYGIRERSVSTDECDTHAERIGLLGYSVLTEVVPEQTLSALREKIDTLLEKQASAAGGRADLERIGEAGTLRGCLALDPLFLQIAVEPRVTALCERLLGGYFIIMLQNTIVVPAGRHEHHQAQFHRDLPYQHFVSSRPLSINALLCVDDFTIGSGCTHALPGTHKTERFPSDAVVSSIEIPLEAPAGSIFMFDAMMYHRSGINTSNKPRRGVNTSYCLPFIKQQISLPGLLGGAYADDPKLSRILGYDSEPPQNVAGWYERRRAKDRAKAGPQTDGPATTRRSAS